MNIRDILLIIIIIYLVISHFEKNNKENFAVTDDIIADINEIYNTKLTETLKSYVKYSDNIRITNRGTGKSEYGDPYIGICGFGQPTQCSSKVNVTMVENADVSTFKIVKG